MPRPGNLCQDQGLHGDSRSLLSEGVEVKSALLLILQGTEDVELRVIYQRELHKRE